MCFVHVCLSTVPEDLPYEQLISDAHELFQLYPPSELADEAEFEYENRFGSYLVDLTQLDIVGESHLFTRGYFDHFVVSTEKYILYLHFMFWIELQCVGVNTSNILHVLWERVQLLMYMRVIHLAFVLWVICTFIGIAIPICSWLVPMNEFLHQFHWLFKVLPIIPPHGLHLVSTNNNILLKVLMKLLAYFSKTIKNFAKFEKENNLPSSEQSKGSKSRINDKQLVNSQTPNSLLFKVSMWTLTAAVGAAIVAVQYTARTMW